MLFPSQCEQEKNVQHPKALTMDSVAPRIHGNTKRLPKNALSLQDVEYVAHFLLNYTEQHGLVCTRL